MWRSGLSSFLGPHFVPPLKCGHPPSVSNLQPPSTLPSPGQFTITAPLQTQITLYGQELSVLHRLGRKVTATLRFQVSSPSRHDVKSYPHLHPGLPSVKRKKPPYLASSQASPHPSLLPAPLPLSFCQAWPMRSGRQQCRESPRVWGRVLYGKADGCSVHTRGVHMLVS